ncbi:MAG: DUF177 domain-containing protein [Alphaproteobacteria bacterium]|nr:DUF177 domain-containing protein [Alphaproteobacteria bacterium]
MRERSPSAPSSTNPFVRTFNILELQRDRSAEVDIAATPEERVAIAHVLVVESVENLTAHFKVTRLARSVMHVQGEVQARLVRLCGVSLEPFEVAVTEPIDLKFAPENSAVAPGKDQAAIAESLILSMDEDPPDPIIDGKIDLGAVSVEFIALGLDPYPRKPGIEFDLGSSQPEPIEPDSPFAVLAGLRASPSKKSET